MDEVFGYCKSLTSLDLTGFDTTSVISMTSMFANSGLMKLDLTSFDTQKTKYFSNIFQNCKGLEIKVNKETCANIINNLPNYVTIVE